ncbi:MAG: hypothetical protein UY81_C0016G0004 [Candidatus Giovannonibacteria bacterium GW2011_GWA2_53_7]|uniref:Uncharacterized protein n=1 Tax=Candidatus Giovannonibacteria bacterium GW2011_GWA2_53_7 TaxID=1618650 RepID=A0A0G2AV17_9BACT|nr:MAG: hypothetical protein UY81_C0016G0004 [Candidatus Giovannonibacteria bacterium GW2011_GWA2_53_7]
MNNWIYLWLIDMLLLSVFYWIFVCKKVISKKIFGWSLVIVFLLTMFNWLSAGINLWRSYQANEVWQYWLPPYSNLVYIHIGRLLVPLVAALISATLVFFILWFCKKRFNLIQYGVDDIYLLTIAALVSGWPGWFVTFVVIFLVAVVGSMILHVARRTAPNPSYDRRGIVDHPQSLLIEGGESIRLIITPFILPVTAVMIWALPYLNHVTGLEKIRF